MGPVCRRELQDEFRIDSRAVVDAGVTYKAVASEQHTLSFDLGAAWNSEEDYVGGGSQEYVSGLAGLAYKVEDQRPREAASGWCSCRLRGVGRTGVSEALEAAISAKLAMKLGFQYLYDNVPVAGFEKTDTKSTVSLVVEL